MQVITIASNKGGVGKTTIACNLAVYLRSLRPEVPVLVIGLDDQSLLDRMFAPETPTDATSIAIAWKRGDLRPAITQGRHDVHYVPTSSEMGALKRLVSSPYELSRLLSFAPWDGLVLIDTKGDLEILTQNAIAASDLTVLVASDYSAVVEAEKVHSLLASWGRPREDARVLLSLVDLRVKFHEGEDGDVLGVLLSEIRRRELPLFETFISRSPKVEALYTNASGAAGSILHERRGSLTHRQFRSLAHEVLAELAARPERMRAPVRTPSREPVVEGDVELLLPAPEDDPVAPKGAVPAQRDRRRTTGRTSRWALAASVALLLAAGVALFADL